MHPWFQNWVPHRAFNRLSGFLANHRYPPLKNYLIRYFLKRYAVNLQEAQESDPFQYPSFNAFFTRALKSALRPIDANESGWVSPADGCLSAFGSIVENQLLQAKGQHYGLSALLGGPTLYDESFQSGRFLTVYLAPKDYHRVHMPVSGHLTHMIYVPGHLFSVNARTAATLPNLFTRNERVIALFETQFGPMALVLVGAMIVGNIETVWAGTVLPYRDTGVRRITYEQPLFFRKGEEMGRFLLGSTVIVIWSQGAMQWRADLQEGMTLKMGECLGEWER